MLTANHAWAGSTVTCTTSCSLKGGQWNEFAGYPLGFTAAAGSPDWPVAAGTGRATSSSGPCHAIGTLAPVHASDDIDRRGLGIMPAHRETRRAVLSLAVHLPSCLDLLSMHLEGSSSHHVCFIVGKGSRHRPGVLRFYSGGGSHGHRVTILSRLAFHRLGGGFLCH